MEKAYVLIGCQIGCENQIYSDLKKINQISSCIITFGEYDIVAEISNTDVDHIISDLVRKIPNIRSTITLKALF